LHQLGVSIVKTKTFGANFTRSLPFWADGTDMHKIALMCIDDVESKYQVLNKCKLLFDLAVRQQQHLHCLWLHSSLFNLVKFERNFTKRNFYFVTQFMSKRNFYFETEGVYIKFLYIHI
jgi:hypothetical protein